MLPQDPEPETPPIDAGDNSQDSSQGDSPDGARVDSRDKAPETIDMAGRFRGYLPVVLDLETGGFDASRHAILEMAMVEVAFEGTELVIKDRWAQAVEPYAGSLLDPASLKVTGIDPEDPQRGAIDEVDAFKEMFRRIRRSMKQYHCQRAILVAHNAAFDQQFLQQAYVRNSLNRSPFHPFSFIDTASLAAVAFGHTVLSESCSRAGIPFDAKRAHNALYDAEKAAQLFCAVVNRWPVRLP